MAGLLDLFSGRSSDLYGGALTPEQRGGMGNIGLLALAGKLGQLAGPSFSPVPDFGAALGQAAGAYGASQEGAGTAALNAILTGLKGQDLQSQLAIRKQVLGLLPSLLAGDGAAAAAGAPATSGSTGGGAAAPPGAGGGGGGAGAGAGDAPAIPQSEAVDKARYYARLYGVPEEMFLHQINGENGFKASGTSSAGAQGIAQFMPGTARQYGVDVSNVDSSLDGAARYMRDLYQKTGSWETALRRYLGAATDESVQRVVATNKPYAAAFAAARAGGAPGAAPTAAPAGAIPLGVPIGPQGGLLAPTAPNPLSDAEPMVGIPRPRVGPQAAGALPASVPGASPEDTANQILRGWTAGSGGGGPLAAPPGAGTDSYVTPQGPAGDVGPAGPAGPATPRAPLPTMGPAGIELPPMQGPLAAPAPAAAAPAAAAPAAAAAPRGLLAPPAAALPSVPAAPNINPRALAAAGVLSQLGGLPDIFKPLENFYYQSPGYKGQVATAEAAAKSPFEIMLQDRTSANALRNALTEAGWGFDKDGNAVQIPGYNTVAEAKARSIALGTGEGQKPLELAKIQANLQADLAKDNKQLVIGLDGKPMIAALPGGAETAAAAAAAKARAEATEKAKFQTDKVQILGPDGRPQEISMSQYDQAQQRQQTNERIAAGNVAPQPGDIVGLPTFNDFEKGIQSGGIDFFNKAHTAADAAAKNIQWNNESIKLLDSGLYAGWGAPLQLQLARIFNIGGKSQEETIQNTQKFLLERGQQVAAQARLIPGPASDKDVAFLTSLSLGDIALNEGTIRQMLGLYNKYNRQTVDQYNDAATKIRPDVLGGIPLKVQVDPALQPMDPETRQNAQNMIARGAKAGPIRNKIRANGMDPEGL